MKTILAYFEEQLTEFENGFIFKQLFVDCFLSSDLFIPTIIRKRNIDSNEYVC